jgi:hypothetical protein
MSDGLHDADQEGLEWSGDVLVFDTKITDLEFIPVVDLGCHAHAANVPVVVRVRSKRFPWRWRALMEIHG